MARATLSEMVHAYSAPYLAELGIPYLAPHLLTVIRAVLFWFSLQFLSAGVSPLLFPKQMNSMNATKRVQWDMHFVALVHSVIVAPTALYIWVITDRNTTDMVFGYDYYTGQLYALSYGYFIWDTIQSLRYEGLQFFVHGALATVASTLVWHPFLMYDGLGILIWEASTPFLNIHWFMDKLGMTGSKAQLVNAAFLLSSYVLMRLILGVYISYSIITMLWAPAELHKHHIPLTWKVFYTLGLVILNSLNHFWFSKMVQAIQKRFPKKQKTT